MSAAKDVRLFASSYAGSVTTLSLVDDDTGYHLKPVAKNTDCGPRAVWLTIDHGARVLFCLNEGLDEPEGSLNSFRINHDGSLELVHQLKSLPHPVSGAIYNSGRSLALAHYRGSGVTSWNLSTADSGQCTHCQELTYTLSKPGPNASRQKEPHCHEVVVDPTGQYVLVTDLGADMVRVYEYQEDGNLTAKTPFAVVPGSGPRDAVFFVPDNTTSHVPAATYLLVVTELSNTVTSYAVTYLPERGGLSFEQVYTSSTFGGTPLPAGEQASDMAISPDNRFVVIANRNKAKTNIPEPKYEDGGAVPINSLSTFAVNDDGTLTFKQLAACGGAYPQQFAINQTGDLVAVSLQRDNAVALLKRDVKTGLIGDVVTMASIDGDVTCVRWDQKTKDGTNANR